MRKEKPYDRRLKDSPLGKRARKVLRKIRSALLGEEKEEPNGKKGTVTGGIDAGNPYGSDER